MTTANKGPVPLPDGVLSAAELTSEQLDAAERHERIQREKDLGWVTREVITTWTMQQNSERSLRERYAKWVLFGLAGEILLAGGILIGLGSGKLVLEQWMANVFFGAIFTQVAAVTLSITKYLFPQNPAQLLPMDVLNLRYTRTGEGGRLKARK
jgi:hypothetical protein